MQGKNKVEDMDNFLSLLSQVHFFHWFESAVLPPKYLIAVGIDIKFPLSLLIEYFTGIPKFFFWFHTH